MGDYLARVLMQQITTESDFIAIELEVLKRLE
jgi:hypothetical protein